MLKSVSQGVKSISDLSPELLKGMADYWKIQSSHHRELNEKLLAACMDIPDIAAIIKSTPKELMEKSNRESLERSRKAFEEGEWKAYFDNLRREGERYAISGVSFGAWIDLLRKYKGVMEPMIAADLDAESSRALTAVSAMHELLYVSIDIIGEAYVAARERVMQRQKDELVESNEVLEQFAFAASHDLKSPLRAIDNLAHWIEEDLGDAASAKLAEHLSLMHQRISRMGNLLDGLLLYSKAGMQRVEPEGIDFAALANEVVDLLSPPPGIQVIVASDLPKFRALQVPLRQVLSNLVSNAIKHHGGKGYVKISARDLGANIEIEVEDDGPGIDPRYHERIFAIFQTLKPKDEVEGSGIGLAMVKRTLARHGGSVSLKSALGQGSVFRVLWPKEA